MFAREVQRAHARLSMKRRRGRIRLAGKVDLESFECSMGLRWGSGEKVVREGFKERNALD